MDPGGKIGLQMTKNISGSFLGGVWGCYLGSLLPSAEAKRLWEMPGSSLRWIPEEKFAFKREKTSWVDSLEESGAATWDLCCLQQSQKGSGRCLGGVSGGSRRKNLQLKEKKHLG